MKKVVYNLVLKPEPEGGYTVVVPSLPGCVTYGKTLEDAKKMAKEAIEAYVASLKKHKESIPTDESSFFTTLDIDIKFGKVSYA
jgi:predicted RNase H-like HicB family nuclease